MNEITQIVFLTYFLKTYNLTIIKTFGIPLGIDCYDMCDLKSFVVNVYVNEPFFYSFIFCSKSSFVNLMFKSLSSSTLINSFLFNLSVYKAIGISLNSLSNCSLLVDRSSSKSITYFYGWKKFKKNNYKCRPHTLIIKMLNKSINQNV